MAESIPIVDVAALVSSDAAPAAQDTVESLGRACAETGFFAVRGHGVDPALITANADAGRRFFELSADAKLAVAPHRWNPASPNVYRGYFPSSADGKEGLDIGEPDLGPDADRLLARPYYEMNRVPDPLGATWAQPVFRYYDALLGLGRTLIAALARYLGGELGDRVDAFRRPVSLSTLRFNHYPAVREPSSVAADDGVGLACEAHVDSGLLTVLYQADDSALPGLQVRNPERRWIDVPPDRSTFVVNTGLAFETLSRGAFRATRHRVVHTGRQRLSIPFFVEPAHDFKVSPRSLGLPGPEPSAAAGGIDYESFLARSLQKFPEYDR